MELGASVRNPNTIDAKREAGAAALSASSGLRIPHDWGAIGGSGGLGKPSPSAVRQFDTGATRDLDDTKPDYEGFLSPLVIEAFGVYMTFNRHTAAGLRDSDNWQKGIPLAQYMKSGLRHAIEWWKAHRGFPTKEGIIWACLGLLFNVQGYLHEYLKANPGYLEVALKNAEIRRAAPAAQSGKLEDAPPADVTVFRGEKPLW